MCGTERGIVASDRYYALRRTLQRRAVLAPIAALLAVGCAHYARGIRRDDKPRSDSAYLYGRFAIKSKQAPLGLDGYQTMGLVLRCADGETYTMRFSIEPVVQVFRVKPSRCSLVEWIGSDQDGGVVVRRRPPRAWVHAEAFQAERAYYLGDYFAVAKLESRFLGFVTERHFSWDMSPADDRYEVTTAEMRRQFANLASLPTEDRRIAPRRPPPPPGAIGPPLSPDRVARIAPFTKRRYTSPAECEQACSTGQCLPYRGEDRVAAMACLVRCRADGDCPQGFGCNCPDGDGTECHPIARVPDDDMAGICLSIEADGQSR